MIEIENIDKLKAEYPDIVFLFKVGDFYEAFNNDATTLAEHTRLTTSKRVLSNCKTIRLCGFPCREIDKYLIALRSHDITVAIINNEDEAKTFNYKINKNKTTMERFISSGTMLYTMIDEMLTQVKIKHASCSKNLRVVAYAVELNGKEIIVEPTAKFYCSEEHFKRGDAFFPNAELEIPHLEKDEQGYYQMKYIMEDGEPKEAKVYIIKVIARHERDFDIDYYGFKPEQLYDTYKDCLANNDYEVKLEDGTEIVRTGVAKLARLTPEQEKLKDELEDVLERLDKTGVRILYSSESDNLLFVNENDVKINIDLHNEDGYDYEYDYDSIPQISSSIWWVGCDDSIYLSSKDNK